MIEGSEGHVRAEGEVATTLAGFAKWVAQYQLAAGTSVALENGTTAFFAARELSRLGLKPVVVDAQRRIARGRRAIAGMPLSFAKGTVRLSRGELKRLQVLVSTSRATTQIL